MVSNTHSFVFDVVFHKHPLLFISCTLQLKIQSLSTTTFLIFNSLLQYVSRPIDTNTVNTFQRSPWTVIVWIRVEDVIVLLMFAGTPRSLISIVICRWFNVPLALCSPSSSQNYSCSISCCCCTTWNCRVILGRTLFRINRHSILIKIIDNRTLIHLNSNLWHCVL